MHVSESLEPWRGRALLGKGYMRQEVLRTDVMTRILDNSRRHGLIRPAVGLCHDPSCSTSTVNSLESRSVVDCRRDLRTAVPAFAGRVHVCRGSIAPVRQYAQGRSLLAIGRTGVGGGEAGTCGHEPRPARLSAGPALAQASPGPASQRPGQTAAAEGRTHGWTLPPPDLPTHSLPPSLPQSFLSPPSSPFAPHPRSSRPRPACQPS